jgi:hypothetical protein
VAASVCFAVLTALAAPPTRLMSTKGSSEKALVQYTSYGMAVLIPAALVAGQPFGFLADYTLAFAVPAHMYIGARSILIDYVPDRDYKRLAIYAAGGLSLLTAFGLLKLNLTDVGITEGFKLLWKA